MNKFKIGDYVVWEKHISKESFVFKIDSEKSGKAGVRHATDDEIKAGRRL